MLMEQMQTDNLNPEAMTVKSPEQEKQDILYQELHNTIEKLKQAEASHRETLEQIQKSKRRFVSTAKLAALTAVFAVIINFHREMGQVGWNIIQTMAAMLHLYPNELCGLLLFCGAAYLLLIVAKWVFAAAADDIFGGKDDDLFKW